MIYYWIGEEEEDERKRFLDSGCSRYMTRDYLKLSSFTCIKDGGSITVGDNDRGKILGYENLSIVSTIFTENILLVDGLKHNLLSIT